MAPRGAIGVVAALLLTACGPSKEDVEASVKAKSQLAFEDSMARRHLEIVRSLTDTCRPEDYESRNSKRVVRCLKTLDDATRKAEAAAVRDRREAERLYVESCRRCAPAADCEWDRRDMERPITQTSTEWTPCIK